MNLQQLQQLMREQEADHQRLTGFVEAAEAKIAGLDKGLRPDIRDQRITAIREDAEKMAIPLRQAMVKRVETAQASARSLSPEGERRAARFHADDALNTSMTQATFDRLGRTSAPELIAHLDDAIEKGNLALAEAVRVEFGSRTVSTELKTEFGEHFGRLKTPNAELAVASINRIAGLDGLGAERLQILISGRRDPIARISAARLAGNKAA